MEKRLIIAIVLSVGVLYAYSYLFPPPKPQTPPVPAKQAQQAAVTASAPAQSGVAQAAVPQPAAVPTPQGVAARDITVDTDLYTAVFSTQGGALKKFTLKKYHETEDKNGKNIVLVDETAPARFGLLSDSREFGVSPTAVFTSSGSDLKLAAGSKGTLDFTTVTPQGITFTKSYSFSADSYRIGLTQQVQNSGAAKIDGSLHLVQNDRVVHFQKGEGRYEVYETATLADNKVSDEKLDNLLKAPVQYDNDILWSAFGDKYFVSAIVGDKGSLAHVRLSRPVNDEVVRDLASPPSPWPRVS